MLRTAHVFFYILLFAKMLLTNIKVVDYLIIGETLK